jgi:hypothetical protein
MRAISGFGVELAWSPTEEEIDHWEHQLREGGVNPWQNRIVNLLFLPRVRRVEYLKTRTIREYAEMALLARRWLQDSDMPTLAQFLLAKVVEGPDGRRLAHRKKFIREFMDSAQHVDVLGSQFEHAAQAIIDSGVVIDLISVVYSNRFERLPEPGEEPPEGGLQPLDARIEVIAQEMLRFVSHVEPRQRAGGGRVLGAQEMAAPYFDIIVEDPSGGRPVSRIRVAIPGGMALTRELTREAPSGCPFWRRERCPPARRGVDPAAAGAVLGQVVAEFLRHGLQELMPALESWRGAGCGRE